MCLQGSQVGLHILRIRGTGGTNLENLKTVKTRNI